MAEGDAVRPIPGTLVQPHEPGEVILPENAVVFPSHGHRGAPIYMNFNVGDHVVYRKKITPQYAIEIGLLLIEAAARELGHRK